MRRVAFAALLFVVVVIGLVVGVGWLIGTLLGQQVLTAVLPAVALVIGLLILVRLVRAAWRDAAPLGDLIDASERMEAGEVGTQVRVRGPREVRSLARAFNAMSARFAADTDERRRLLADVSHELRTPLTVIQGNVEGMLDGLYPADREHLERLLAETRQMERLIEDLRTLSLADAGALPLHREPVDLAALAEEVVAGFVPAATEAGVDLEAVADPVPSLSLDPPRVRQVLGNLLSNALRHTPRGGRVTVSVRPAEGGAELVVADTGEGMDAAVGDRPFERFWRGDGTGETGGAGLGLAIVRDLVLAHGGDVSLESAQGSGTTVRCRFPSTT